MHKIFVLIRSTEVIVIFLPRDRHYIIISCASCSNTYPFLGEQFRRKIPNKLTMERRAFFLFSRQCLHSSSIFCIVYKDFLSDCVRLSKWWRFEKLDLKKVNNMDRLITKSISIGRKIISSFDTSVASQTFIQPTSF